MTIQALNTYLARLDLVLLSTALTKARKYKQLGSRPRNYNLQNYTVHTENSRDLQLDRAPNML